MGIRVRVKRSSTAYFPDTTPQQNSQLTVGGLPLTLTNQQLEQLMVDRNLPKKASPVYLLPCPPDDLVSPFVDFWYVSKKAWVCRPQEAKWHVVDVVSTPKRKTSTFHRM